MPAIQMILQTLLQFSWIFVGKLGPQLLTGLDIASPSYGLHALLNMEEINSPYISLLSHLSDSFVVCVFVYSWPSILT